MSSQHVYLLLSCQKLNKGDTLDHQREESEQQQNHRLGLLHLTIIIFYRHCSSHFQKEDQTFSCTCDCIHLLLRWRVVICDLAEWRERDVCVQVQAQHEIMHLALKKKRKLVSKQ